MNTKKHRDQRQAIAERDFFTCQHCGKYIGLSGCVSDRISQSKANRRKYGNFVVDHFFNKCYTCINNQCNDGFNIANKPNKSAALLSLIFTRGNERLSCKQITELINV
jgi:hypothetical protein